MKIVQNKIIPFPGYLAINICGVVFTRDKKKFLKNPAYKRHEYTHTLQWKELWYVGFLPVYCYYYLKNRIWFKMNHRTAYRHIPLEAEAYNTQNTEWYNEHREKFAWRYYLKMLK